MTLYILPVSECDTLDSTLESLEQFPLEESLEQYPMEHNQAASLEDPLVGGLHAVLNSGTTAGVSGPSQASRGAGEGACLRERAEGDRAGPAGMASGGLGSGAVGKDVPDKDKSECPSGLLPCFKVCLCFCTFWAKHLNFNANYEETC